MAERGENEVLELDDEDDDDEQAEKKMQFTCKDITYQIKLFLKWLLQDASINLKFDDLMMFMTFFVLFGDSFKIIFLAKSADNGFVIANTICLFFFIFEFLASTWFQSKWSFKNKKISVTGYIFSFFWCMDIVAIVSMFPDITWIAEPLGMGTVANATSGDDNYRKAGRIVRLIRLIRLIKIFKIFMERRRRQKQEEALMLLVESGEIDIHDVAKHKLLHDSRGSKIGEQVSATITQRVIVLILVILIILPLLTYQDVDYTQSAGSHMAHNANLAYANGSGAMTLDALNDYLKSLIKDVKDLEGYTLLRVMLSCNDGLCGTTSSKYWVNEVDKINDYRATEYTSITHEDTVCDTNTAPVCVDYVTTVVFDIFTSASLNAEYTIYMTIFIGCLMIGGASIFTGDAQTLIINPIERMMNLVEVIAKDPLRPLEDLSGLTGNKEEVKPGDYEIKLLEGTIKKITDLLRIGFGEAGAGIIANNLDVKGSSKGMNALLPGLRVYAIVGFCDIHHFEDVMGAMGSDIMPFVNTIANIVHSCVHTWKGQCNKNLGNAFVIVWRIGDEVKLSEFFDSQVLIKKEKKKETRERSNTLESPNRGRSGSIEAPSGAGEGGVSMKKALDLKKIPQIDVLADSALIAYLKVIVEINRDDNCLFYRNEQRLTKMMNPDYDSHLEVPITPARTPVEKDSQITQESSQTDSNKLADAADHSAAGHKEAPAQFKISMGFGLHAGWAIEGAVGSIYKIDATYLSPHVNMAARLETSSRQYGVPLLMSHFCHELLSEPVQKLCRRVDIVTVKGSEVPIGVFTYDALQDQLFEARTADDKKLYRPKKMNLDTKNKSKKTENDDSASTKAPQSDAPNHSPKVVVPINGSPPPARDRTDSTEVSPSSFYASNPLPLYKSPKCEVVHFSTPSEDSHEIFSNDSDLIMLRSHITTEFNDTFDTGLKFYLNGHWSQAKGYLEKCNEMMLQVPGLDGDGPSKTLLKYMGAEKFVAPASWAGYRPLTSK